MICQQRELLLDRVIGTADDGGCTRASDPSALEGKFLGDAQVRRHARRDTGSYPEENAARCVPGRRQASRDFSSRALNARTDKELTRPSVLARHLRDRARPKSDIREHLEPKRPRKEAELVCIVHNIH